LSAIVFVNAFLIGAFSFASLHHLYMWRLSRRSRLPLLISAYCGLSALLTATITVISTASSLAVAQLALDARTTIGLTAAVALLWLIASLTSTRPTAFLIVVSAVLGFGAVVNLVGTPVVGTVTAITHRVAPWGEPFTVVQRHSASMWLALVLYVAVISVYAFAVVAGVRWSKTDRTAGRLTALAGAGGVATAGVALLIDLQLINLPYIGQVPNGLWILLATVLVSRQHASHDERIEASRRRFRAIFDQTFQFIGLMTTDGRLLEANRAAMQFAGVVEAEVIGRYYWDTPWWSHSPELQARLKAAVAAAAGGDTVRFEATHPRPDGGMAFVDFSLKPVGDEHGAVTLLISEGHDITERRLTEERLRQSQKMEAIGQLAGGVAHDFNNLLTVIAGYADILHARLPETDPRRDIVKAISDATERGGWLTARLLAFGRRAVLSPQVFDLNVLVGDGERILRRLIGEHIALQLELSPQPLHVELDPGQWSQLMLNLAINARDAMPSGGGLVIRTFAQVPTAAFLDEHPGLPPCPLYAGFSVKDTGVGMTTEVSAHIFEPFFTTKEVRKGTGLGLAVVHGIVTQGNGCINVATSPGAGTTITVFLPRVAAAVVPATPVIASGGNVGAGETVLVVEDEAVLRELLEVSLTSHGFRVVGAGDGDEAMQLIERTDLKPDLLITDMVMPGRLNGRTLANAVVERVPGVRVLFISGYIDDPSIREAGFGPREQWLQKPFSLATIARKARDTLDLK